MTELPALDATYPQVPVGSASLVAMRAAGLVATISQLVAEARFGPSTPAAFAARACKTARRILDGHGVEVTRVGIAPTGPAVIVANHLTYLDPLVVSCVAPCISIAKGETRSWPLVGAGLEGLGVLFVRRRDAHSGAVVLRRALRALTTGTAVLNFPEGTTSDGREIGPFLRGAFGLARLAGQPLVPARIMYDTDRAPWFGGQSFAPHYARLARVRRVRATVCFGEPISATLDDDPQRLADRARDAIAALRAW